jgi:hypothetical protein
MAPFKTLCTIPESIETPLIQTSLNSMKKIKFSKSKKSSKKNKKKKKIKKIKLIVKIKEIIIYLKIIPKERLCFL